MKPSKIKIEECCQFVSRGKTPKYDENGTGNIVKSAQVQIDGILWQKCSKVSDAFIDKHKQKFSLKHGDVLLNGTGTGTLGRPSCVDQEPNGIYIPDSHVNLFRVNPDKLFYKYLFYWLLTPECQRAIELSYTGSTNQIELSATRAGDLAIPILPIEEQRRIAELLDKADAIRRKRKEAIRLTESLLRSAFLDMFGDPVTNPKGWEKTKFGAVIETLSDYHANGSYKILKKHVELLDQPNYAWMVRTTDLEQETFLDNAKYITKSAYEFLSKSQLFGEEIIINKIGSAGKVYLMPHVDIPTSLGMNAFLIRTKNICLPNYAYYFLKSNYGQRLMNMSVRGAVTKTITKKAVRELQFLLPPISLQETFNDFVTQVMLSKQRMENELLDTLFSSLLQRAFRGDL